MGVILFVTKLNKQQSNPSPFEAVPRAPPAVMSRGADRPSPSPRQAGQLAKGVLLMSDEGGVAVKTEPDSKMEE